jgi:uncharacterized protein (DUF2062 family)
LWPGVPSLYRDCALGGVVGQGRLVAYRERVQDTLRAVFSRDQPPRFTAASFALGLFIIALPNLGLGIGVLAAIGYRYERADPVALGAAVVILNPLVKGVVYVASFALGAVLLGPISVAPGEASLAAGPGVLARLLLGNLIIALVLAAAGYAVALYGIGAARRYR